MSLSVPCLGAAAAACASSASIPSPAAVAPSPATPRSRSAWRRVTPSRSLNVSLILVPSRRFGLPRPEQGPTLSGGRYAARVRARVTTTIAALFVAGILAGCGSAAGWWHPSHTTPPPRATPPASADRNAARRSPPLPFRWLIRTEGPQPSIAAENRHRGTRAWRLPGPAKDVGGLAYGSVTGYVGAPAVSTGRVQRIYVSAPPSARGRIRPFRLGRVARARGRAGARSPA